MKKIGLHKLFLPAGCRTISLLLLLNGTALFSQTFPVQIRTQILPPYSGYLTDYADPSSEKLKVILQFNDFSVAQYQVKLKFEIKGNGFSLSTLNSNHLPPITLLPGQPLLLSSLDLAPYLNSNNLIFNGINRVQYEKRMALPEGYYSICIKAYDYYNSGQVQVSNEACAQAWFTLSDPPFLNLPICNAVVKPLQPQNIFFQWTPMNQGSPNSSQNTEYEFALWEMRPDSSIAPNQVALSANPVFSTTTGQTFLNYGILETPLNLYMKYVWRVRAKDVSGRDWFKNDGYSQVCTFTYGDVAGVLGDVLKINLHAQTLNHRAGRCDWTMQSAFTNYLLQVRKQGTEYWFDYPNTSGIEKVGNLEPSSTYECRVRGEGNGLTGEWSNVALFTTMKQNNYACNDPVIPYNTFPNEPLPLDKAISGLIFQSGQFEVTTSYIESAGMEGWYTGRGFVSFYGKRIAVSWKNIYIDSDSRHQQGKIEALTDGMDKMLQQWDIDNAEQDALYVNDKIDSVYLQGNKVCYSLQGSAVCVPIPGKTNVMVIRDGEGNQYTVRLVPAPREVSGPTTYHKYSHDSLAANENQMVVFKGSNNQKFGFDEKKYAAYFENYEVIKLPGGKNYFVPNKSVGEGASDEVLAEIKIADFKASELSFKTRDGSLLSVSPGASAQQLKIQDVPENADCIYAWYQNKKVGKLNVLKLRPIIKKLVLVPVNGANPTLGSKSVDEVINKIFSQAHVKWDLKIAPNFTFDLGADGLETADAGLMTKYSPEMRELRDAYKKYDSLYDKGAYHVFVVPRFNRSDQLGYMVRGKALGFVSAAAGAKALAHELAHGAFGQEHSFPALERETSDNLMDYTSGTQLVRKQWEMMQHLKLRISLFDEEEDGSYRNKSDNGVWLFEMINKLKMAYKNSENIVLSGEVRKGEARYCYLGGFSYDYIRLSIAHDIKSNLVGVKGKVKIGEYWPHNYPANKDLEQCILIDGGKIVIEVPAKSLTYMKAYIESPSALRNLILFVNGYRSILNSDDDELSGLSEYANTDNSIEFGDSRNYWEGIDAKFMNRIGTKNAVYADGHHSVSTSNHLTTINFLDANIRSLREKWFIITPHLILVNAINPYLHTKPNLGGFLTRQNNGAIAANNLVRKISAGEIAFDKSKDTLDIVAHSMGYAYAVGMIKSLKSVGIRFGRFYILAPENASSGSADWSKFQEVWQYGSNEKVERNCDQDGVAPQCMVQLLDQVTASKGGRVYIPDDYSPKGFLPSHSISNYGWIFTRQLADQNGYVKTRK
jgi:hypothetical protein